MSELLGSARRIWTLSYDKDPPLNTLGILQQNCASIQSEAFRVEEDRVLHGG